MKRRNFIKNSVALGATVGVAGQFSGCGNSNNIRDNKKVNLIYKHDWQESPQSFYDSLTPAEKIAADADFSTNSFSTEPYHDTNDKLVVVSHKGSSVLATTTPVQKSVSRALDSNTTTDYTIDITMPKDNYAMHMFYKKIDANNPYVEDSEDDLSGAQIPKYSLLQLALIVPKPDDKEETITFDNSAREIVKALIFSTPAFQHFSRENLSYALSKFDDIFTGKDILGNEVKIKTNLERAIKLGGTRWYYYQVYKEKDGTPTLRKTQSKDDNGEIIHDIGDPIYTFPLKESLIKYFNKDLNKVIQYFSADDKLSPEILPRQKQLSKTKARFENMKRSVFNRAANYQGLSYKIDTSSLKSEGLDIVLTKVDSKGLHISATNSFNRHSQLLVIHLDKNDEPVGNGIEQVGILSPRLALMSIPLEGYSEDFVVSVPTNAYTSRFFIGSLSFIDGHNRRLYSGSESVRNRDSDIKTILTAPEAYTIAFELALPALLLLWGANLKRDNSFNKLLLVLGLKFAKDIALPFIGRPNLRGREAFMPILAGMGTTLLKAHNELEAILIKTIAMSEAEDSMPIAGQVLRAINIAVDVSNLSQTIYAVSSTRAINIVDVTRTHTLKLQLRSDPKDNDFPLNVSSAVVTLTHRNNTIAQSPYVFTWDMSNVVSHTVDGKGTYSTYDIDIPDVPAGGVLDVSVQLKIGNWIAAHKKLNSVNNVTQTRIEVALKENLIPLGSNSIYQHYAKLTKSNSTYSWNVKAPNDAFLPSASVADSERERNELLAISVNDPIGTIGYSYKDLNTNEYIIKNVSAVLETPNQGLKSSTSSNMMQLSYNLTSSSSTGGHLVFEHKDGFTYVRNVDINSQSTDFKIDYSKNIGMFITDKVSQFAYYPTQKIVAGLDTNLGVLHILHLLDDSVDDSNTNRYLNAQSMVKTRTIVSAKEIDPKTQYMYNPQLLAMSPTGDIVVLEKTKSGATRLRAFDKYGTVDLNFSGFNNNSGVFEFKEKNKSVRYLDVNIESKGFIYILKQLGSDPSNSDTYLLDIYDPFSTNPTTPIVTTIGFSAAKIKVDYWRRIYGLNYETTGGNEPTISVWIPPVPA